MAPSLKIVVVAVIFSGFLAFCAAQVELDDRFLNIKGNDMWLIEFYAPWCGHCKKLEPVYREVYKQLRDTPVRVGKIDATRFSEVAHHFQIRGFPTILFVNGDQVFTHRGDRSKESIIEFVNRAQGPAVRKLSSVGKFTEAKSQHSNGVFFMYIGHQDEQEDLFKKYRSVAESMMVQGYFYAGEQRILQGIEIKQEPTVLVFKDKQHFEFSTDDGVATKESVQQWVNRERYSAFPEISGGSINEMADVKKYLVIVVVDPDAKDSLDASNRMKSIAEDVALKQREKYHRDFQFLWMGETETANSITMSFLTPPALIVLEVEPQYFYLPPFLPTNVTHQLFTTFLDGIRDGTVTVYGGTGFFQRLKRLAYDILSTLVGIWQTSRWLFLLMFGIPTVIISIICYSLCCMESLDEGEPLEDSDSEAENFDQLSSSLPPHALQDMPAEGDLTEASEKEKEGSSLDGSDPKGRVEKKND